MAQVTETRTTSAGEKALAGFLSSIKSGATGDSLFASLLAQTEASWPQVEVNQPSMAPAQDKPVENNKSEDDAAAQNVKDAEEKSARNDGAASEGRRASKNESERAQGESKDFLKKIQETALESGAILEVQDEDVEAEELVDTQIDFMTAEEDEAGNEVDESIIGLPLPLDGQDLPVKGERKSSEILAEKRDGEETMANLLMVTKEVESHLKALEKIPDIKPEVTVNQELKGLNEEKKAALESALSGIAEEMRTLKDSHHIDSEPEASKEQKLTQSLSEGEEGPESLWLKTVQSTKAESMGQGEQQQSLATEKTEADNVKPINQNARPFFSMSAQPGTLASAIGSDVSALKGTEGASKTTISNMVSAFDALKPSGSYNVAGELSASRTTKGGMAGLPHAIEQVAVKLHKAVKEGIQEITIQLRPAELGRIDIKLEFGADKTVTGTVLVDNQATLALLQKDADVLQRALQEAGLQADAGCMEFSLRDEGDYASAFSQGQKKGTPFEEWGGDNEPSVDDGVTLDDMLSEAGEVHYITPGRVNIQV